MSGPRFCIVASLIGIGCVSGQTRDLAEEEDAGLEVGRAGTDLAAPDVGGGADGSEERTDAKVVDVDGGGPIARADGAADALARQVDGGLAASCGQANAPLGQDPAVKPDPISVNGSVPVKTLNAGDWDQSITQITAFSAGAGMVRGTELPANTNTGGWDSRTPWKWKQPGAFLEYAVNAAGAGTYSINVIYAAAADGGRADILLNGARAGRVTFRNSKTAGGYGGIPAGLSRSQGTVTTFPAGPNKIRVAFTADSTPVDVLGIQVNASGHVLQDGGKVQPLKPAAPTTLQIDAPSDFYRGNYSPSRHAWPSRSFFLVEYLVQAEKAGAYELTMDYRAPPECAGAEFLVDGQVQGAVKFIPGSGVTRPKMIRLPCGASRVTVRNPNYLNGVYCGFGGDFGRVHLKPLP